ncbi:reverse transcriptase domain-containing protein [Tanacetum coccineum]
MFGSKRSRDNSKYYHFHEDYGHDTNDCRHLKIQIQEAINSGQLSHLVKDIKKEKTKVNDTPRGEAKKDKSTAPTEAPILMVNRGGYEAKETLAESKAYQEEITLPPIASTNNAPVIIEAEVFGRKVGRVYMDNRSSCEKSDGGWRMCVDFADINKACPKDCYPLPEIDYKVESLSGFRLKCFLDAYKGYHLIQMAIEDEDKIAFFEGEEFSATGRCLEGLFLGHLITKQGIKFNLAKIKAVIKLEQPQALKDIQSLNGKLVALSHFLSKGAERSLPFFKILKDCKGKKKIEWTDEADSIKGRGNPNMPIKQTLAEPEKKGRIAKWAIELGEHDIVFRKREETSLGKEWKLFTDRASSFNGTGAGLMLIDPEEKEYAYALRFEFETNNNEAEYEALLAGLRIAQEMEIKKVVIFLDLQLVVNQIKGSYVAKQLSIKEHLQKVKIALKKFEGCTVEHIQRNQNKKADALSKLASMTFEHLTKEVLVKVLNKRSIEEKEVLTIKSKEERNWMSLIQEYLVSGLSSKDEKEAQRIRI